MADKQSRLAEIYKAEKSKGGGIASTLGKRALEKMDPRQFFNQKGFLAASLPSLFKSYSATPTKSGEKLASAGGGSFSSGVLETKMDILTGETRELKIHSKIAAKNSESLPIMARDMNLMRQNITKLVKLQGGTAASRADMFFMKSGERESAYENRFIKEGGKSKTPTQVDAKPKEEKKGIFATIMEGLSSIFSMKGLLIAGILAAITFGIKEYFSNDEFKGKMDALVSDLFSTIKSFLVEYWKEVAFGLALLFPSATMALISSGISILSSGITLLSKAVTTLVPLLADGLTLAFRGLITLLSGPAGLIVLLGGALFAARKLFESNQEEYLKLAKEKKEKGTLSEKDETRLKQLNSPANEAVAEKELGYNPITGKLVTKQEANRTLEQRSVDKRATDAQLRDQATEQLMNEGNNNPTLKDINTRFEKLKKQRDVMNSAPNESSAETARLAATGKPTPVIPTPQSTTPSTKPTAAPSGDYASRIGGRESGGNYDTIFGKAGGATINGKLVTENTIGEVAAWQAGEREKKSNKQAAGKYQFMDVIAAAKLAGLGPNDLFNGPNQEKMMAAYTESNAKQLRAYGLPDTEEYLSMAHAVGAKGTKQLIDAQNAGMGGANSLDVLGLKGAAAKTNPQLNTNVDTTIAALKGGGPMGHGGDTMLAKNKSGVTSASYSASTSTPDFKMPTVGTLAAAAPNIGDMIASATSAFGDITRTFDSAMASVTNITNNNTQAAAAAQQSQGALPSVYDDVFLSLFQRVS